MTDLEVKAAIQQTVAQYSIYDTHFRETCMEIHTHLVFLKSILEIYIYACYAFFLHMHIWYISVYALTT